MARKNRISINAFDEAACISNDANEVKWRGLTIEVLERIGYADMAMLVSSVADASFGEDGSYHPESTDFALRLGVIALYTNLSIPSNIEKRYDMAYATDVYDRIEEAIDPVQIGIIREAIERRVGMRVRAGVDSVIQQAGEVTDAIMELKDKINERFDALLGDINPDEMKRILQGISENGFDEEKVVKAYMQGRPAEEIADAGNE